MPTQLNPKSETSTVILTSTGSASKVAAAVPFGMYTGSADFLSGAASQVAYVYKKLGAAGRQERVYRDCSGSAASAWG